MNKGMVVFFYVSGIFFGLVGLFGIVFGGVIGRVPFQVSGVIVYACSLPFLFQARFSELEKRITALENRVKK